MMQSDLSHAADSRLLDRVRAAVVPTLLFLVFATLPFNRIIAFRRVLLVLAVIAAIVAIVRLRRWPKLPWPVWAWFAVPPLSVAWSVQPRFTFGELAPDLAYPLLGLLLAVVLIDRALHLRAALAGLMVGAVTVAIAGLALAIRNPLYDWYELAHGVGKVSTFLVLILPFVWVGAAEALRARSRGAIVAIGVAMVLFLLAGYSTHSRAFWVAAAAAVLATTLASGLDERYRRRDLRRSGGAAVLAVGLTGLVALALSDKRANVVSDAVDTGLIATITRSERYEMWRFWLDRAAEHPWLGIGFGYDLPMRHYQALKPAHWFDLMFAHSHNVFLDVTIQTGVFGLAVFVAMLAALFHVYFAAARSGARLPALAGIVGLGLLTGMIARNLTDDFFTRAPLFTFWVLNGLLIAAVRLPAADSRSA